MKRLLTAATAVATLAMASLASADHHEGMPGLNADIIGHMADAKGKIFRLAEAMPDKKYSWRPAKDVRSVSEVYMHVTSANYFIGSMLGAPVPEGMDPMTMEKSVTEKAKVIEAMKKSFDHVEAAIKGVTEAQYAEMAKTPMGEMSKRQIMLLVLRHADEHLGQSIAYARMNGVAPPWTAEQEAAAKAAADKGGQ
jgi:uncharacterized damage-inducible protein DinB